MVNTDTHIGEIMLNAVTSKTKSIMFWFGDLLDSFARSRAAAELTRHGHHDAARRIMLKEEQ